MLIFTTNNRAICVCSSERRHYKTRLSLHWTHQTSPRGWTPLSQTFPIIVQRRPAYDNHYFLYVTSVVDYEQPVGEPCYPVGSVPFRDGPTRASPCPDTPMYTLLTITMTFLIPQFHFIQLSSFSTYYNCLYYWIKVLTNYTFKLYAVDWVYSGRVFLCFSLFLTI